jgi:hypothetical protein
MGTIKELAAFVSRNPAAAAVMTAAALAAGFMLWHAARRLASGARNVLRGQQAEDLLTVAAAGVATAVAMNGMWRFFGAVLGFSGAERVIMFAFLEIAVVTSAFRARRNMREFGSAGVEGAAVWVLSGLSALFAALDARSAAEAVFRLAPPLVAAWLWHRAMSLEHRRSSGRVVHWRLTLERVLVWLGLAEPSARAAGEVDAHRRIARLARAAKRLRDRRAAGAWAWRQERARRRLDKALEAAVEHADLASDAARQDQMRDQIVALNAAESLASLAAPAPWDRRDDAGESARVRELEQSLAAAVRDLEATRRRVAELTKAMREAAPEVLSETAPEMTPHPALEAVPDLWDRSPERPLVTPGKQPGPATPERLAEFYAADLAEGRVPSKRQIKRDWPVGYATASDLHDELAATLTAT